MLVSAGRVRAVPAGPLHGRVIFLGDSITYSGQYIEYFETALRLSAAPQDFEVLNLGLPSETASGLSEPNHAGGAFPRPDLNERLERVLQKTKPAVVFASYGMNDGIYYPFSEERFKKFQDGMRRLHNAVETHGARMIHLTPPVFDVAAIKDKTLPAGLAEYTQPFEGYNQVLDHYSQWLVSMRADGWEVVDIHGQVEAFLHDRRVRDPKFLLAGDGVHPDDTGHWVMTRPLLQYFGVTEFNQVDTPDQLQNSRPQGPELFKAVAERQRVLKDAWLTETGHKRPGMARGLPLREAEAKAAQFDKVIHAPWAQAVEPSVAGMQREKPFAERFLNPPAEHRIIKIIHGWPDEPQRQDELIGSLKNDGFGGVVCNVSFTDYLESEARWKAFVRAVAAAREAGFALWLYDEKGYPSGAAGGLVLRDHPEWEARGLLIATTNVAQGTMALQLPPGKPVLASAYPIEAGKIRLSQKKDLAGAIHDGRIVWEAPQGTWQVLGITEDRLHEGTHASMSLAEHLPYPNLLMREPTARFLELTHERYAALLGQDLGRQFISTFTDEPSLMSLFLKRMPYRVLPWAPGFSAEFKARRGYPLEPLLAALVADAGSESSKARYDFWKTVGELVSENYFGQIQSWCGKHGLRSGGHLLMEENLANHVPLYGDFFQCLRRLDAPSIDCLTSIPDQVPWYIARLASSAAELDNQTVVMCETSDHSQRYRPQGDTRPVRNVTEPEIRGTCNRLLRAGINAITSYYSFAELSHEQLRRLNAWVGRCCAAISGGHQVTDIGVVYPVESVWTRFSPSRIYAHECAEAVRTEQIFRNVSDALYGASRDFLYVDSRTLTEGKVEGGSLIYRNVRLRVIVLPGVDTLPMAAWERLEQFAAQGGIVIAIGALPLNSEVEFPSARVQDLSKVLFGENARGFQVTANAKGGGGIYLPAGWTTGLRALLRQVLPMDVEVSASGDGAPAPIQCTHRRIEGQEVYFVINDGPSPWRGSLRFAVEGAGERWDPATGTATPVADGSKVPLELEGYGATVLTFAKAAAERPLKLNETATLDLRRQALPAVSPEIARGEFVREKMETATRDAKPMWRITGTLTKSQVDTYLFARLIYKEPLDLRGVDALVFDTTVPEGQRMPGQLLVILHENGGADYLANTGRVLGSPGTEQCWLSPQNFQLAGWSSDANGHLDLSEITEIRIGWGGYLGEAGETVEFTLSPVELATLPRATP
jgi:lysophospholipase L1-like esterase